MNRMMLMDRRRRSIDTPDVMSPPSPRRERRQSYVEQFSESLPLIDMFGSARARMAAASGFSERWLQWLTVAWDTKLVNTPDHHWDNFIGDSSMPLPPSRLIYSELRAPVAVVALSLLAYWYVGGATLSVILLCCVNLFYFAMRGILKAVTTAFISLLSPVIRSVKGAAVSGRVAASYPIHSLFFATGPAPAHLRPEQRSHRRHPI